VKEAVFSMLGASVQGAAVIDIFAGTGGLGIEALSRGAARCWFCDVSASSVAILRQNLALVGIGDEGAVLQADFRRALQRIAASGATADIVFADPPYDSGYYEDVMQTLLTYGMMSVGGLVVLESAAEKGRVAPVFPGFCVIKSKRYGHTAVDIYERTEDE
jgi:16S rRNA (guanine(966)-N(2))-methyltransferase RsmD